jgi:hypothetical protein
MAKDFKVYYKKVPGSLPTNYTMDHSAGSYVYDPKGRIRLYHRYGSGAAALAGDNTPPPMFDNWLANAAYVMGLIYMLTKIAALRQPKPPLHQQFAPIAHSHPDVVSKPDQDTCRAEHTRELMTIRQEMGGFTGKVERQLDHLRNLISTQNAQMMAEITKMDEKNEKRILHLHERLDPLPAAIAVNTRSVETHLADHRAGKA